MMVMGPWVSEAMESTDPKESKNVKDRRIETNVFFTIYHLSP
jgi:hypothetical protein